jgi:UDP:flavonoid glycosyltransferase YjiC (YdhE family)
MRAGKPTFVTPYIFDQFFWAHRVYKIGAGPAPVPFGRLSEERLTDAISKLVSGRFDETAGMIGQRIQAEDSRQRTVEEIERASQSR